jgi:hypothetical protein
VDAFLGEDEAFAIAILVDAGGVASMYAAPP